jgi:branched-chain amino acid transport system permease protein
LSIAAEFPQREGAYAGGAAGLSLPPGDRLLPACDLSLAVAAGSVALAVLVGRSRLGLALMSLREDEEVAAGLRCACLALQDAGPRPERRPARPDRRRLHLAAHLHQPFHRVRPRGRPRPHRHGHAGGVGHAWGPVLGAVFITLVEELLWTQRPYLHLPTYGVILLLVGFYLPGGLVRLRGWARLFPLDRA